VPIRRYGCFAALILITFTCNGCLATKNPLIGTWKWDNAKTLQELSFPYKIVETHNDYIIVDQPNNGEPYQKFPLHFSFPQPKWITLCITSDSHEMIIANQALIFT
jgi:hypothetical protein